MTFKVMRLDDITNELNDDRKWKSSGFGEIGNFGQVV